ncbi:hypothetical protein LTS18_013511, partial [Coniosporium uncinatum]
MGPPSRPASALSNGRPLTTDSESAHLTTTRTPVPKPRATLQAPKTAASTPTSTKRSVSGIATPMSKTATNERPATVKSSGRAVVNSKTMVVRGSKARSGLAGAFERPKTTPKPVQSIVVAAADSPDSARKIAASSTALREQIKEAKAAARRVSDQHNNLTAEPQSVSDEVSTQHTASFFESEHAQDPFNRRLKQPSVLRKRVDAARTDGKLNIAALGLKEIPEEVMKIYDFDANAA